MRKLALVAVLAVTTIGCASSKGEQRPDETATGEQALSAQATSPMAVEGAAVRSEETADGAALVFTTTGDVGELRRRVGAMVERHTKMQEKGGACPWCGQMCPGAGTGPGAGRGMPPGPKDGMKGGGMGHGPHGGMQGGGMGPHGMTPEMQAGMKAMQKAKVRMEEVEGGARLVFTPADPADLPALRQAVQTRASMMASCPMMKRGGMPPAGTQETPPAGADE